MLLRYNLFIAIQLFNLTMTMHFCINHLSTRFEVNTKLPKNDLCNIIT